MNWIQLGWRLDVEVSTGLSLNYRLCQSRVGNTYRSVTFLKILASSAGTFSP